jgi:hypothetical protein
LRLTAVFESWHIGDGNYPPLKVGQAVNLSFQVEPVGKLERTDQALMFDLADDAECAFVGEVIRIYRQPTERPLGVFQAGAFRFYIEDESIPNFAVGHKVRGAGTLLFDYYIWVEFLHEYAEPPNLFYTLEVKRIRKVTLPIGFVTRRVRAVGHPTRLRGDQYAAGDIQDLESMEGQKFGPEFYLIDLDSEGVSETNVPKTFLGS